jgi:trk system potassium uptake protein TrkA
VPWTSSQIVSRLLPGVTDAAYVDAEAGVALRRIAPHHSWVGHPLTDIEAASACRVAYVVRFGEATLPVPGSLLQSGDEVYFVVPQPIAKDAERALARPRTAKA